MFIGAPTRHKYLQNKETDKKLSSPNKDTVDDSLTNVHYRISRNFIHFIYLDILLKP